MAPGSKSERSGDPMVATLLTWFLPGAGHLYLGQVTKAVAAFVLIEGLYALGWMLSGGRAFEFLDPELRGLFATVLTPEIGNLGAMIAQVRYVGFGNGIPSPFSDTIHWGSFLCALSGIGNVCWMVDAHLSARTPSRAKGSGLPPGLLIFAAWAFPGLGHFLQGRKLRAVLVCALLLGLFVLGTLMAEGSNLSRERHFYYWSGQFLLGLPSLLAEVLSGRPPVTGELSLGDVGLLYASMPGLLNVLAMLDVHGVAEKRWFASPKESAPSPSGAQSLGGEVSG